MLQTSASCYPVEFVKTSLLLSPFAKSVLVNGHFDNIVSGEQRSINRGMKVRVYRNLNKPEFFSVMAQEGKFKGKVCAYARSVLIAEPKLVISEASRQRVLKQRKRNVHSFVEGYLEDASDVVQLLGGQFSEVTYNPYRHSHFYCRETGEPVYCLGSMVVVQAAGVYIKK